MIYLWFTGHGALAALAALCVLGLHLERSRTAEGGFP